MDVAGFCSALEFFGLVFVSPSAREQDFGPSQTNMFWCKERPPLIVKDNACCQKMMVFIQLEVPFAGFSYWRCCGSRSEGRTCVEHLKPFVVSHCWKSFEQAEYHNIAPLFSESLSEDAPLTLKKMRSLLCRWFALDDLYIVNWNEAFWNHLLNWMI